VNKEITVAWVSRHDPLKAQKDALKQKLGDINLVCIAAKSKNANELYSNLKAIGAQYAVVVLPFSVTMHLLNNPESSAITYLRAEMEPANGQYNPDTDVLLEDGLGKKRHVRFKEYKIITGIDVRTKPFEVTNHGN
jgi:hypothetical protein